MVPSVYFAHLLIWPIVVENYIWYLSDSQPLPLTAVAELARPANVIGTYNPIQ
jgi:hypothetical protein